jgi:hypothetical protein
MVYFTNQLADFWAFLHNVLIQQKADNECTKMSEVGLNSLYI